MSPKDQIKDKISIYETVSHYIRLEKSGNQWKARCPFHNEKTPSFYVSPQRQSYHCFGCGKHGDIFTFVMEIEKIEFLDALKVLAKRAGVSLSDFKREENDNLYEILIESQEYFVNNLKNSNNILAKKYLLSRGLTLETIEDYHIGFADTLWTGLLDHLIQRGFKKENILESGVCFVSEKSGKVFDKWRGRIMFPICGQSDQVLGFTGRILPEYDDGKQGKYVNSPETKVFKKNQILFNYNKAKNYISQYREVILVEGQMDAIMAYQAGVKNVVAVSGTAFTENHINILKRLADSVTLCFDNDAAGKSARDRTALLCSIAGFEVYNLDLVELNNKNNTNYKDIADIVSADNLSGGLKDIDGLNTRSPHLQDLLNNKKYLIETLCYEAVEMEEKVKIDLIKRQILPLVKSYNSPLIQNHYLKIVSKILDYDIDMLKEEIKTTVSNVFVPDNKSVKLEKPKSYTISQAILDLAVLYDYLSKQKIGIKVEIEDEDFVLSDSMISDFIRSRLGEFDFYNIDIFKSDIKDMPQDEIDKRFIELESKDSIKVKYFFDLVDIVLKDKIEGEKKRLMSLALDKNIFAEDRALYLKRLHSLNVLKKRG